MPRSKTGIFLGSTEVPAAKSQFQLQTFLAKKGARSLELDYDKEGNCSALRFRIFVGEELWPYRLPVRIDQLADRLNKRRSRDRINSMAKDREQAERIAWRQLFMWVQAQFAMIDLGMVQVKEVFLPYTVSPQGQTVFEVFEARGFKMLGAGVSK